MVLQSSCPIYVFDVSYITTSIRLLSKHLQYINVQFPVLFRVFFTDFFSIYKHCFAGKHVTKDYRITLCSFKHCQSSVKK